MGTSFLGALDTYTKKINPPSAVLGGGGVVHSKVCWLIGYCLRLTLWEGGLTHQLGPRYEGQLMSDGGAYSLFRSILLVLTHDFIITCVYGPRSSDGQEWKDADAALRTIFVLFEAKGMVYAWDPVQPANGPPTRTTSG